MKRAVVTGLTIVALVTAQLFGHLLSPAQALTPPAETGSPATASEQDPVSGDQPDTAAEHAGGSPKESEKPPIVTVPAVETVFVLPRGLTSAVSRGLAAAPSKAVWTPAGILKDSHPANIWLHFDVPEGESDGWSVKLKAPVNPAISPHGPPA